MRPHACDEFFDTMEALSLALEYDDATLRAGNSEVQPHEVNVESAFSRNIRLKTPIVTAGMDTVTEAPMAIAIAKLGGIGVIHRNLAPAEQARHVREVKRHLNGLIESPVTFGAHETIEEILNQRAAQGLTYHSFPIVSGVKVVGVLTSTDFDFCADRSQKAEAVMSKELITAPPQTTLAEAYRIMMSERKKVLPLINESRNLAGMYVLSDVVRCLFAGNPLFNTDRSGRLRVAAAVGVYDDALERLATFPKDIDAIVVDTAHGDSEAVLKTVRMLKERFAGDVIAGNVSEPDAAHRLHLAGADGIKVGQGPGSICTTRVVAGVGCPQLTAVHECARALRSTGIPVCADGGINYSGDIPKAIAAGADCVMIGRLFAGCDEAPGETIAYQGGHMKKYRGMGSLGAMRGRGGGERYRQADTPPNKLVPEGVEAGVPYAGPLEKVHHHLIGGLRAGMGYVGVCAIEDLQLFGNFRRVTVNGLLTAHPHDVMITAEAPNYRR